MVGLRSKLRHDGADLVGVGLKTGGRFARGAAIGGFQHAGAALVVQLLLQVGALLCDAASEPAATGSERRREGGRAQRRQRLLRGDHRISSSNGRKQPPACRRATASPLLIPAR